MIAKRNTQRADKRYTVEPQKVNGLPVYVVVDGTNGHWVAVRDCMLWAEHKAEELNQKAKGDTYIGKEKSSEN